MVSSLPPVGVQLREWRQRRHLSQLELACEANVSTRHLSFLETGRSQPSRDMVLHLAELLGIPLRQRNVLLMAAGFAPFFPERPLDDPALAAARRAVDLVLTGHEPYPAVAVDRHWTLVTANNAARRLLGGVPAAQLVPPINVLRVSLHPEGLAPRIINLVEWRSHILARLRSQIDATADPILIELSKELAALPAFANASAGEPADEPDQQNAPHHDYGGVVVPMRLALDGGVVLSLFSTTTIFGTPVDVTLSELAVESFFP
ncbi:MAG TPA: helix-turn-helix transcriptional regulator, partial [Vicinamibacterales bacterium]|nr:helix-turn-helix transcriptional regulator [Vicinamibacterales bacterium]